MSFSWRTLTLFVVMGLPPAGCGRGGFESRGICDELPVIELAAASSSLAEDDGAVALTFTLSGERCGPVSFELAVTGGTATQATDFTVATQLVDDVDAPVVFTVLDDSEIEGEETFEVTLAGLSGAVLGPRSSQTVTIYDDDFDPVALPSGCASLGQRGVRDVLVSAPDAQNLPALIAAARPGDTFVLGSGSYALGQSETIIIAKNGVTIRSATGNAGDVVLDRGASTEPLFDIRADNVTIAHLTIDQAGVGGAVRFRDVTTNVKYTTIYDVTFSRPRGNIVQTPPGPTFADNGTIACSRFSVDDTHRATLELAGECTSSLRAIALISARDWRIADNTFAGFSCSNPIDLVVLQATQNTRDLRVERNRFVDNVISMRLGLASELPAGVRVYGDEAVLCGPSYVDVIGAVAVNNAIFSTVTVIDSGIAVWNGCNVDLVHNTVAFLNQPLSSGIEYRYATTTGVRLINNLVAVPGGPTYVARNGATLATSAGNVSGIPTAHFVAPDSGDLHLLGTSTAVSAGDVLLGRSVGGSDIESVLRDALPDAGAYEYVP